MVRHLVAKEGGTGNQSLVMVRKDWMCNPELIQLFYAYYYCDDVDYGTNVASYEYLYFEYFFITNYLKKYLYVVV